MPTPNAADVEEIRRHIDGLFKAYFRGDRETIKAGHTDDWCGFQIPSRSLVKGIDGYMEIADRVLSDFKGLRYEMLEVEVSFVGEVALVFYVAREWLQGEQGQTNTILLRSLDVYRKEGEEWNQCASNIVALPDEE